MPPAEARSGTTQKIAAAAAKVNTDIVTNTPRQSVICSAASTGAVAAIAPRPPENNAQPVIAGRRCSGYQSVNALMLDMRQADTPRPISTRPASSAGTSWLNAKTSAPEAAASSSDALVRRGPKRSSKIPTGI